jgi:hypothetical protein
MDGRACPEGLSQERQAEASRFMEVTRQAVDNELWRMACLMASKESSQLLGQTEFELREHVLRIGAIMVENAVNERRKKGGTKAAASPAVASTVVGPASTTRSSSTGVPRRS